MVEPIYCLKPAWCGRHLAGLRPETGLTVRYGATAFKAVGYHSAWPPSRDVCAKSIPDRPLEATPEQPMSCASPTTVLRQAAVPIPETAQSPSGLLPQPRNRLSLCWTCFPSFRTFSLQMFPTSCPTKFRAGRWVLWVAGTGRCRKRNRARQITSSSASKRGPYLFDNADTLGHTYAAADAL